MKNSILINSAIIIGTIAFNILFWNEGMGINTVIFTLLIVLGIFITDKEVLLNKNMQIITLGTILLSLAVCIQNSLFSLR